LHLPSWGAFQRSLTLLVRYRSRDVFSLGRRCRPYSRGNSNPRYSGTGARRTGPRYGVVTLYHAPFQGTSRGRSDDECQSVHHIAQKASVWTGPLSLAVTDGITLRFLFLPVLRCFNSRRSPLREAIAVGIPIRKSQVLSLRAAPLSLSQLGTSFIGARAEPSTRWQSSHAVVGFTDPVNRVQWTSGSHVHTVSYTHPSAGGAHRPFPPTLARGGASVFVSHRSAGTHLRGTVSAGHEHGPTGIRTQGLRLAKAALYR
jgi:hypothetical protein